MTRSENYDSGEIAKFEKLAARWWDPGSEFKTLHDINPLRLDYIDRQVAQIPAPLEASPRLFVSNPQLNTLFVNVDDLQMARFAFDGAIIPIGQEGEDQENRQE